MKINDNISKNYLIFSAFLLIFVFLTAFSIYNSYSKSSADWINNVILAVTAVVIMWYALETAAMKREMAKQNKLSTRPILILSLESKTNVFLKNEGKGPALNALIEKIEGISSNTMVKEEYEFLLPSYITQESKGIFTMLKSDKNSCIEGTVSENDSFFTIGKTIEMVIKYEDIENNSYKSHLVIQAGRLISVNLS